MKKHASFHPVALLALPVLSLALLVPPAVRAADTVLDRRGDWMLLQSDNVPGAKALYLADAFGGSRTLLSTVALPSSTATNVYWDAYAARDPETDTYVPALVTNVSPVGADYEFRAFLNGGHAYWEDSDDGNRRLWSVACGTPSEKCMLAFWDKSQAPLEPCDPSEAPPSSFFFAMPLGGGVVWEQPDPDSADFGEIHAATGTVAAIIATNAYDSVGNPTGTKDVNRARAKSVRAATAAAKSGSVTVSFDPNGGDCDTASKVYTIGQKYGALPTASNEGAAFLGWFTHPVNGNLVTPQSLVEKPAWDPAWDMTTWGGPISSWGTPPPGDESWTLYGHWEYTEDPLPVWRFYSSSTKGHFFTINEAEKTKLLTSSPTWKFEGKAYRAFKSKIEGTVPLYRFYSEKYKGHFFTINEAEKANLVKTSKTWKYQGIAYYVFPKAVDGAVPVYRFWSDANQHHFYTASEAEKNSLVSSSKTWKYQGIAFWAFPKNMPSWKGIGFHANGGTITLLTTWGEEETSDFGQGYPFGMPYGDFPVATRRGYAFLGWFTEETGGTRLTPQMLVTGTASYGEVYAHWEPAEEPLKVWRFYSEKNKGHFFTINEAEKSQLMNSSPTWSFQGAAYRAYKTNNVPGTVPLYRFYSESYKGHFFTRSEKEKESLRTTSKTWKFQGIAYYVYPNAASGRIPVYRFWSESYRHHFYTANEKEKDNLVKTSKTWAYQGIAFWALPMNATSGKAVPAATQGGVPGGADSGSPGRSAVRKGGLRIAGGSLDVEVTTSDGSDGSAAADGDEGTAWTPEHPEAGSWLVLTFAAPLDVAEVTVLGENLPEETRVLLSEDAETWFEGEGGAAQYVWVAFPPVADGLKVREVRVAEDRE